MTIATAQAKKREQHARELQQKRKSENCPPIHEATDFEEDDQVPPPSPTAARRRSPSLSPQPSLEDLGLPPPPPAPKAQASPPPAGVAASPPPAQQASPPPQSRLCLARDEATWGSALASPAPVDPFRALAPQMPVRMQSSPHACSPSLFGMPRVGHTTMSEPPCMLGSVASGFKGLEAPQLKLPTRHMPPMPFGNQSPTARSVGLSGTSFGMQSFGPQTLQVPRASFAQNQSALVPFPAGGLVAAQNSFGQQAIGWSPQVQPVRNFQSPQSGAPPPLVAPMTHRSPS